MAFATRSLSPDDEDDSFQPRLFFLDHSAIIRMKGRMPQYRDCWGAMDGKTKGGFSFEDGVALKALIATFFDDAQLLFVFRPFNDLGAHHGYLLIRDPSVLLKLRLKNLTTQTYTFKIWPSCVVSVTEEQLTSSMGFRYFMRALQLRDLLKSVAPNSPLLKWNDNKLDKEGTLREVYYADTPQMRPLPELFRERGWTFEHFGFCSNLVLTDPGIQIPGNPKIRKLKVTLSNGTSVHLHRLVDLKFFDQFRQSISSPSNQLQMQFSNPNPQNITTPVQKTSKKDNPNLIPILGPRKRLSNLSSSQNLLVPSTAKAEAYPTPPHKILSGPFTMSTQLPMLSLWPSQEEDTMTIYSPIESAAEDPCPRFYFNYSSTSTHDLTPPEDATKYLKLSKRKMKKLDFRKRLTLFGERFSISFRVGGSTLSVGHKGIKNIGINFAQKILRILETGYSTAKEKKKKNRVTQTEDLEFGQQWDKNQAHEANQVYSNIATTISQQWEFEESQSRKVITLAQYKNKLNSNWNEKENESQKVQDSKRGPAVSQNFEKAPEIQEKPTAVEKLELKSNQILATPRKPKIIRKLMTPKQLQLQKESQAIINQTLTEGLGLKLPELFPNVQKKEEEQVLEKQNVTDPVAKSSENNNEKDGHEVDNDLLEKVQISKHDDDNGLGAVGITPSDDSVEPRRSTLELRRSERKAKSTIDPKLSSKADKLTKEEMIRSRKRKFDDDEIPSDSKNNSEAKRARVATRKLLKRLQPQSFKYCEPEISFKPNSETTRMLHIKQEVKQEPMEEEAIHEFIEEPSIFIKEELDLDFIAQASQSF